MRTFPAEGLDVYANTTLMDVKQNNSGCKPEQLALLANDAANEPREGQRRRPAPYRRSGFDGSVDFHYVLAADWAEQVQNVQKQTIQYQSFHLPSYELLNASVGYHFLKNQAEMRGVGLQPARRPAPRAPLRSVDRPARHGDLLLQVLTEDTTMRPIRLFLPPCPAGRSSLASASCGTVPDDPARDIFPAAGVIQGHGPLPGAAPLLVERAHRRQRHPPRLRPAATRRRRTASP